MEHDSDIQDQDLVSLHSSLLPASLPSAPPLPLTRDLNTVVTVSNGIPAGMVLY